MWHERRGFTASGGGAAGPAGEGARRARARLRRGGQRGRYRGPDRAGRDRQAGRGRACKGPPRRRARDGMKKRLDVLLVERGLAESRSQAQALVLAGRVPGFEKPGTQVEESVPVSVEQPPRFVSRGGEKLDHALTVLGLDV